MRALAYSGHGCAWSISPLTSSHPKPPSASAAARPKAISRLASASRHSALPGSLTDHPSCSRLFGVMRGQLTRASRDQVDREDGPAAERAVRVLDALDEPFDGDTPEASRVLIED